MNNNIIINDKPYTKDSKGFYMMPNELHFLLHEIGLTAQEKLIYECLVRYSNNSENNPFPSYSTIQKFASCGRATVSNGLKKLQKLGLVAVLSRGNNIKRESNVYKIKYIHSTEGTEATKSINYVSNTKPLPQPKKQPQKVDNDVIPFTRGKHSEVVTSKEAKELLAEYESAESIQRRLEDEERAMDILDLL